MNTVKIVSLLMLLLWVKTHYATDYTEFTAPSCSTDCTDFFANHDPRFLVLTALGVAAGGLGLWIIKKSVDKILSDNVECEEIPMREKILALGSETLATLIGLLCTVGGGMLIITDNYKINSAFNT